MNDFYKYITIMRNTKEINESIVNSPLKLTQNYLLIAFREKKISDLISSSDKKGLFNVSFKVLENCE